MIILLEFSDDEIPKYPTDTTWIGCNVFLCPCHESDSPEVTDDIWNDYHYFENPTNPARLVNHSEFTRPSRP